MDMIKLIEGEQKSIIEFMKNFEKTSKEYLVLNQRLIDLSEAKRNEAEYKVAEAESKRHEAEANYFKTEENAVKAKVQEMTKMLVERLDKVEYQLKEYIEDEEDEKDKKVVRMIGFA